MLFDTDILIWVQRGNAAAARLIENDEQRMLSLQSYLELLQCAENRRQLLHTRQFIKDYAFQVLPLTENIGHRAAVYVEEYTVSHGLRAGDAIVAATAAEHGLVLCTSNYRHFRAIRELTIRAFKPQ